MQIAPKRSLYLIQKLIIKLSYKPTASRLSPKGTSHISWPPNVERRCIGWWWDSMWPDWFIHRELFLIQRSSWRKEKNRLKSVFLLNTIFGWISSGQLENIATNELSVVIYVNLNTEIGLNLLDLPIDYGVIKRLWKL